MLPTEEIVYWLIFANDCLLLNNHHVPTSEMLRVTEHTTIDPSITISKSFKIGMFNNIAVYCASTVTPATAEIAAIPLRQALSLLDPAWYTLAAKAHAILNWDKNHQYCGHCGHATEYKPHKLLTFERICPICHLVFYPRISPSVIVLIHKQDHILMARSPHFTPGAYGLIAGFVEAGESVEEAVIREVQEEVSISIKNLRYFGSQSWPFPDSLMLAFTAEYAGGELVIDHSEIETAGWYHHTSLPGYPSSSISIARRLIDDFINNVSRN
jgi:NAD+ diphosphatase